MANVQTARQQRDELEILARKAEDALWILLRDRLEDFVGEGYSQADLAERIGRSEQQISRWLAGPTNLTIKNAALIFAGMDSDLRLDYSTWASLQHSNSCDEIDLHLSVSSEKVLFANLKTPTSSTAPPRLALHLAGAS